MSPLDRARIFVGKLDPDGDPFAPVSNLVQLVAQAGGIMALHATIQKREDVERKKLGVYGFKAGTGSYKGELLFSIEWQGETVIAHLHVGGIDYAASVSLIPELSTFRADSSLPESHKAFEVKLGAKAIKTLFYDRRGQSTMYKAAADSICLAIHSKWLSGNR